MAIGAQGWYAYLPPDGISPSFILQPISAAWRFRVLPEPILSQTLQSAARTRSDANGLAHSIQFQPASDPSFPIEDRRYACQWRLPNGLWTCLAVFDGNPYIC